MFQHPSSQGDYLQIHPPLRGKAALLPENNRRSTASFFQCWSIVSQTLGFSPNNIQQEQELWLHLTERWRAYSCFVSSLNAELRRKLTTNKFTCWSFFFISSDCRTALINMDRHVEVLKEAAHESYLSCFAQIWGFTIKYKFIPRLSYPQLMVSVQSRRDTYKSDFNSDFFRHPQPLLSIVSCFNLHTSV